MRGHKLQFRRRPLARDFVVAKVWLSGTYVDFGVRKMFGDEIGKLSLLIVFADYVEDLGGALSRVDMEAVGDCCCSVPDV